MKTVIAAVFGIACLAAGSAGRAEEQRGYVPEPRMATTEYLIGAHYFPGWKQGTHFVPWPGEEGPWGWHKIEPFPDRTPLLGYYDEGSPEVADWEIKWALEHGISYFLYCWYRQRDNVGKPVSVDALRLGHAIHEGLFHARYRDRFQFAIMWENNNGGGVTSEDDLLNNLAPFWISDYFQHPSYLKIDNKPVLFVYHLPRLIEDLGDEDQVCRALERLRAAVVQQGFDGLVMLCEHHFNDAARIASIGKCGFDGIFPYGWQLLSHEVGLRPTADEAVAYQIKSLEAWRQRDGLSFVPVASMGRDPMPWQRDHPSTPGLSPARMMRWRIAPEQFQAVLARTKTIMDDLPTDHPGRRMLLLDNWNEWGEGHFIAPHAGAGFGYLKAVRDVFTSKDNEPDYRSPAALGLGPYDSRYRQYQQSTRPD